MVKSVIPSKKIFKRIVKSKFFSHQKTGNWPFECTKEYLFLLTFFGHVLTIDHEPNADLSPKMNFLAHISIHAFFLLFH